MPTNLSRTFFFYFISASIRNIFPKFLKTTQLPLHSFASSNDKVDPSGDCQSDCDKRSYEVQRENLKDPGRELVFNGSKEV